MYQSWCANRDLWACAELEAVMFLQSAGRYMHDCAELIRPMILLSRSPH